MSTSLADDIQYPTFNLIGHVIDDYRTIARRETKVPQRRREKSPNGSHFH